MQRYRLIVRILDTDPHQLVYVTGREAWALEQLMEAGERGCTPLHHPGPRWSGYVHKLRLAGFVIVTIRESHGGDFPGQHARYVLRSHVVIVSDKAAEMEVAHG